MTPKLMLNSLPDETLVQIISNLPQSSLLELSQSSRRLKRLSNAKLYSSVYWEDLQWGKTGPLRYSARKAADWAAFQAARGIEVGNRHVQSPSRIFRYSSFLDTTRKSPDLRSLISTAAFESQDMHEYKAGYGFLAAGAFPHITSLHLALGSYEVDNLHALPLTSLSLFRRGEPYNIDYLHSLFSIPTLRWLCIKNVRWNKPLLVKDDIDRLGTSDIVKLSFPCSTLSASDFAEIITWPKGLKSMGLEIEPDTRSRPQRRRFLNLLSFQKETLEEIFLSGDPRIDPILDYCLNDELLGFTALKRLSIGRTWFEQQTSLDGWTMHDMWKALPTGLEQLQIEEPIIVHYSDMRWDGVLDVEGLAARREIVVILLQHIAEELLSRPLALKQIAVWLKKRTEAVGRGSGHFHDRIGEHEDLMAEHLFPQGTARAALIHRFREGGCELSNPLSSEPPLFEV